MNTFLLIIGNETSPELIEDNKPCVQKIIVEEKTSSALIIMGLFFIVVVIGLFYYLPRWTPEFKCISAPAALENSGNLNSEETRQPLSSNSCDDNIIQTKMHSAEDSITVVKDQDVKF